MISSGPKTVQETQPPLAHADHRRAEQVRQYCQSYVLHVKQGYEEREASIRRQFATLQIPWYWILDYDIPEITPEIMTGFNYAGGLRPQEISCCLKHITAWKRIAAGTAAGGIVFEDDVLIDLQNFVPVVLESLEQFHTDFPARQGCICLGAGCALYVPWTRRRKGKRLYAAEYVRAADSYWLSRQTAGLLADWIKKHGFHLPADHLIDLICSELNIPILWMEPTVVCQGSHNGHFASSIQLQERRGRIYKAVEWWFKRLRRKYLLPLCNIDLTKR